MLLLQVICSYSRFTPELYMVDYTLFRSRIRSDGV